MVHQVHKVLAQHTPSADSLEPAYTVPNAREVIVSSLTVCNTNSTSITFRIRVAPNGDTDTVEHALYHEIPVSANDTFVATIGLTLAATDVIRVQASATLVAFHVYGMEQ